MLWGAREALGPEAEALIDYLASSLITPGYREQ
jgi:hypothetical protein